ncbi:hypothetical protein Ahia01_000540900 [Argonauta hians]
MLEDTRNMDKKTLNRNSPVPAKNTPVDHRKPDNARYQRSNKKRENPGRVGQDAFPPKKVPPPKPRTASIKRPRIRGNFNDKPQNEVAEQLEAEFDSLLVSSGAEPDLTGMLNFDYGTRRGRTAAATAAAAGRSMYLSSSAPSMSAHRGWPPRRPKYQGPVFNKQQYLQANCQFIVKDSGDYSIHATDPDKPLEWDCIEQVRMSSPDVPLCPICLSRPMAGKITKCGHIYCWSCILHYLALSDRKWCRCPICNEPVYQKDLKSVKTTEVARYKAGDKIQLNLMRRDRGSTIPVVNATWQGQPSQLCNLKETEKACFSQVLLASNSDVQRLVTSVEDDELALQMSNAEQSEVCFIESAMAQQKARIEALSLPDTGDIQETLRAGLEALKLSSGPTKEAQHGPSRTMVSYVDAFDDEVSPTQDERGGEGQVVVGDGKVTVVGGEEEEGVLSPPPPPLSPSPTSPFTPSLSSSSSTSAIALEASSPTIALTSPNFPHLTTTTITTAATTKPVAPTPPPTQHLRPDDGVVGDDGDDVVGDGVDVDNDDGVGGVDGSGGSGGGDGGGDDATVTAMAGTGEPPTVAKRGTMTPTHNTSKDTFYFYQAADGQHIYLHAVNARCLAWEYGSLEFGPQTITADIVEVESIVMTQDLRNRLRYLSHLPLSMEFKVVEVILLPPVISRDTLKEFSDIIQKRAKYRLKKQKLERLRCRRIEEENRKHRPCPVRIVMSSADEILREGSQTSFPELVHSSSTAATDPNANPTYDDGGGSFSPGGPPTFSDVTADPYPPPSPAATSSSSHVVGEPGGRLKKRNKKKATSSPTPPPPVTEVIPTSFAQKLKCGKVCKTSRAPTSGGSSSATTSSPSPSASLCPGPPGRSSTKRGSDGEGDSDPDTGLVCAPSYQNSFGASLHDLIGQAGKQDVDGSKPARGKKKMKMKMLFSTTMARVDFQ